MLYAIMIFGAEGVVERLPEAERDAILDVHSTLQADLEAKGMYRGAIQLMPPSTAMTVADRGAGTMLLDGPFAESKEQFLGFYLVECETMDDALDAAKALPQGIAFMEVRPVKWSGGL
ncbi:YciI family protein [Pelagibacterium halotolerans]|uniref:YciI family protein n=1 Tax=Pelagibacterium halotolerans TaxID=531813 RepID=UPI00384DCC3D